MLFSFFVYSTSPSGREVYPVSETNREALAGQPKKKGTKNVFGFLFPYKKGCELI
jgi:hypothetical protein